MKFGYARVSTSDQDASLQRDAQKAAVYESRPWSYCREISLWFAQPPMKVKLCKGRNLRIADIGARCSECPVPARF
jgi:hypothetical protein